MLTQDDFNALNGVLSRCGQNSVSLSLHYSECENAWWATVDSPAKSEETITKTYSFLTVMKILNEHLDKVVGIAA